MNPFRLFGIVATGVRGGGGRVNGQLSRRGSIKITCSYDTMVFFK